MSTSAVLLPAHRDHLLSVKDGSEADFLGNILRIRDDVYSGKHTRIRLPLKVLEKVAPRPQQTVVNGEPLINGASKITSTSSPPSIPSGATEPVSSVDHARPAIHGNQPLIGKKTSSTIDPVLLTKSDNLIKAELNLKRLQIERMLKDQNGRKGPSEDDREMHDVDNILANAQSLVQHVSGLPVAHSRSDGTDSFDENSYYSSKANSWSSEEAERNATVADSIVPAIEQCDGAANESGASQPIHSDQAAPIVIEVDDDPYEPEDHLDIYEPEDDNYDMDESDYSPPPAVLAASEPRRTRRGEKGGRHGNRSKRRPSPLGSAAEPVLNPRHRRRIERREARRQKMLQATNRSPQPRIKEEPRSPLPLPALPIPRTNQQRAVEPIRQRMEAPPISERLALPTPLEEPRASRSITRYEDPISSRNGPTSQLRHERTDERLRRVPSVQHAVQPYSPRNSQLTGATGPLRSRAASYAVVERPLEPSNYGEPSIRARVPPRYIRELSPPHIHSIDRPSAAMAPAPRRIVMDRYGNKYLATETDDREIPVGSRMFDIYHTSQRAVPQESVPTLNRNEVYGVGADRMMLPPPPRRYLEASDLEMSEMRPLRRAASQYLLDTEYRPSGVLDRRVEARFETFEPPREYQPTRSYSVLPDASFRELPELGQRHESMRSRPAQSGPVNHHPVGPSRRETFDDFSYAAAPSRTHDFREEGIAQRSMEYAPASSGTLTPRVRYRY